MRRATDGPGTSPKTRTCPLVGFRNPRIVWIVVVLPAPFGPTKATMLPFGTVSESPLTAWTSERTCDEVVMVRNGQVVLADRIASFGASAQVWDIEVFGWTPAHAGLLEPSLGTVLQQTDGGAVLRCDVSTKQALLRAIVAANLDIGSVQPMRAATLEEAYLKHAGVTS